MIKDHTPKVGNLVGDYVKLENINNDINAQKLKGDGCGDADKGEDKGESKGTKPATSSWSSVLFNLGAFAAVIAIAFAGICALSRYQSSALNMVSGTRMEPAIVNLTAFANKIVSQLPERVQQVISRGE